MRKIKGQITSSLQISFNSYHSTSSPYAAFIHHGKELLAKVLPDLPHVRIVDHIENEGCALVRLFNQHGVEGMVCKDVRSIYYKVTIAQA